MLKEIIFLTIFIIFVLLPLWSIPLFNSIENLTKERNSLATYICKNKCKKDFVYRIDDKQQLSCFCK